LSYCPETLPEASVSKNFCAHQLNDISVNQARSILSIPNTDSILVLERGESAVSLLKDTNGDTYPDKRFIIAEAPGLNHGLALHGNYLYATSSTTVYRWTFNSDATTSSGDRTIVITGMNADGKGGAPNGHRTRTIIFDEVGRLYISIGSAGNVDRDSYRSRIRRFDISDQTSYPIDFTTGEVFADGLRNEVGLSFDSSNILWGVENGADNLYRSDLGGDIHNDNPGEELNRFPESNKGKTYGYPYCWSEYLLPKYGKGPGTVWAWPNIKHDNVLTTDDWCRKNSVPSELSMQAHSAPLGMSFYKWKESYITNQCKGSFPKEFDGYAFIAFHGSWNRDPSTGYKVVYVPISDGRVKGDPVDLLVHTGATREWGDGMRPVDVDFDQCGRLLISSDGTKPNYNKGSKVIIMSFDDVDKQRETYGGCCGKESKGPTHSKSNGRKLSITMSGNIWTIMFALLLFFFVSHQRR
jgi:glucose/arabinose dehydrogenase